MARPRKNLATKINGLPKYEWAEERRAHGVAESQMAAEAGVSPNTWRRIKREDEKLQAALERGLAREETALVGALYAIATDPKHPRGVTACIFLLKTRHHYVDQPQPQAAETSRVRVEVRLPAALTEEQYARLVDVTPQQKLIEEGISNGAA